MSTAFRKDAKVSPPTRRVGLWSRLTGRATQQPHDKMRSLIADVQAALPQADPLRRARLQSYLVRARLLGERSQDTEPTETAVVRAERAAKQQAERERAKSLGQQALQPRQTAPPAPQPRPSGPRPSGPRDAQPQPLQPRPSQTQPAQPRAAQPQHAPQRQAPPARQQAARPARAPQRQAPPPQTDARQHAAPPVRQSPPASQAPPPQERAQRATRPPSRLALTLRQDPAIPAGSSHRKGAPARQQPLTAAEPRPGSPRTGSQKPPMVHPIARADQREARRRSVPWGGLLGVVILAGGCGSLVWYGPGWYERLQQSDLYASLFLARGDQFSDETSFEIVSVPPLPEATVEPDPPATTVPIAQDTVPVREEGANTNPDPTAIEDLVLLLERRLSLNQALNAEAVDGIYDAQTRAGLLEYAGWFAMSIFASEVRSAGLEPSRDQLERWYNLM